MCGGLIGSHLSSTMWILEPNSGCQACPQALLPTEPSNRPRLLFLLFDWLVGWLDVFCCCCFVVCLDCWTLITYERYCNAYHGAYMGFITRKGVKSFRVKGLLKGVKNLYIASQWIMAPGGLPVAVTAGKFAVWRIARKDKRRIDYNN